MSSTLLEVTRSAHEDVERLERLIVKELQREPASNRDHLFQNHRVRSMIDTLISTTHKLVDVYEDKDNARKDEIAALGGQTASGVNLFGAFYDRLKEIREYHRRHPLARVIDPTEEFEELLKEEPHIEFSGEDFMILGVGSCWHAWKLLAGTLTCMSYIMNILTRSLGSLLNIQHSWIHFLSSRRFLAI